MVEKLYNCACGCGLTYTLDYAPFEETICIAVGKELRHIDMNDLTDFILAMEKENEARGRAIKKTVGVIEKTEKAIEEEVIMERPIYRVERPNGTVDRLHAESYSISDGHLCLYIEDEDRRVTGVVTYQKDHWCFVSKEEK